MRAALFFLLAISMFAQSADLIFHNGKVVTVDKGSTISQAVAIQGQRILLAGTDGEVLKLKGPSTRVIDLKGRTVLPGLVDSHVHTLSAGLSEFRAPLPPLDSYAAVQKYIREQAAKTPEGEWIVVPRTFPTRLKERRMPTRDVLDVTPHPVMFDASYTVVLNTAGLKRSGITRSTPNPPGGEIVKDSNGEPNGIIKSAQYLVKGLKENAGFTDAEKLKAVEDMLHRYAAAGLTAVSDRAVVDEDIAIFRKLHDSHRLPVRVVMTWRPGFSDATKDAVERIQKAGFHTGTGDEWLKFGAFKVTMDGGMTIGTAYQRIPYGEFGEQLYGMTHPDDRGLLFLSPANLEKIFRAARDTGWQLTAHCQGGSAVDNFLDALAKLDRDKPIRPTRSHLMHASFQSPEAIERAAKMGVLADVQMPWLYYDSPALRRVFGPEPMKYFIPLRSYLDAGVDLAGGSDLMIGFDKNKAVNPYNPFLLMWMAISRRTVDGDVFHPEQRVNRMEALKMHTIWAAEMQFAEEQRGSIEKGKLADLVVTDRDYLTVPEDEIRKIEPLYTVVGGKIVYEAKP